MVSKTMRALLEAAQMQKVVVNGCRNFSAAGDHNRFTHNPMVVSPIVRCSKRSIGPFFPLERAAAHTATKNTKPCFRAGFLCLRAILWRTISQPPNPNPAM